MKNMYNKTKFILIATGLLIVGCQKENIVTGQNREILKPAPLENVSNKAEGTVVVQGHLIGKATATAVDLTSSDCDDSTGFAVQIDTVTGGKKYLFDHDGDPCKHSKTLFNGKLKVNQRAADPSVNITFIDKYGKLPEKNVYLDTEILDITNFNQIPSGTPEEAAMAPYTGAERYVVEAREGVELTTNSEKYSSHSFEPVHLLPPGQILAGKVSDRELASAVNRWKQDKAHNEIVEEAEHLLAGVRNLSRKSSDELLKVHQDQIKDLLVQLRGAEKVIDYQKEKERRLRQEIEKGYRTLTSERRNYQLKERLSGNELAQKEQRAKEYEMIANDLKRKYIDNVRTQDQQMKDLRQDLAQAEIGASGTRQEMILAAAKKIAEAEAIAGAARFDKKHAMEREANRLHIDASAVMRRAMAIDAGENISIPAFKDLARFEMPSEQYKKKIAVLEGRLAALETPKASASEAVSDGTVPSHPMEETTVVIKQEDQTLDAVMKHTLAQLSDRVGDWKVEWKLSKKYASIPNEKWTVIAEARFDEFLAYVQGKVKQTHGVKLKFRRFDNAKLFVISN